MRQQLRSCEGGELCFHLSSQNIATYYSDTVVASVAANAVDDGSLFAAIATTTTAAAAAVAAVAATRAFIFPLPPWSKVET